ncbi:MAG TPA: transporter substrate-binding domain-containing protein [Lachnospiraceae bacterium]|nr:transporter substrate-binding domain-containing protein [Lachnospiraceae bacterium]
MKKKVLTMVLCSVCAVAMLASCGSSSSTASTATASGSSASGKKYVIATDTQFPPFEFTNSDQKFVGIDVDILAAIAKDQGFDYELNSLGFDAALVAVQSGQADGVIAGMSITDERKQKFDFSDAYYDAEVTMAVAKGSDIKTFDDLKGKKVAIKTGTNGGDYAKSVKDKYGFEVVEFKDSPTMYQDVITGNTQACFEDYPVMAYNIKNGAQMVIPDGCTAAGSSYGFAVQKGQNAELLSMFNKGLADIKSNGAFDKIVDSYTK